MSSVAKQRPFPIISIHEHGNNAKSDNKMITQTVTVYRPTFRLNFDQLCLPCAIFLCNEGLLSKLWVCSL